MMRARLWPLLAVVLALGGCPLAGDEQVVALKGSKFTVEIADNDDERMRGLMYRESMAPDAGMLFIFDNLAPQSFWMRNTLIPLDIMYFDQDRRFVSGHFHVPTCKHGGERCPNYPSEGDAQYVLELNAGVGAALNLQPGDVIELPEPLTSR
jgi:uncharacterized protein